MEIRQMLEELGWDSALVDAFTRESAIVPVSSTGSAVSVDAQNIDPGFATHVEAHGEPVATGSLQLTLHPQNS